MRLILLAALVLAGCVPPTPPLPRPLAVDEAAPEESEIVATLFLLGDPGDALPGRSPVLTAITSEVRSTAASGRRTIVAFLGDLVRRLPGPLRQAL